MLNEISDNHKLKCKRFSCVGCPNQNELNEFILSEEQREARTISCLGNCSNNVVRGVCLFQQMGHGCIITKEHLCQFIWGHQISESSILVIIHKIRECLKSSKSRVMVLNIRDVGYCTVKSGKQNV